MGAFYEIEIEIFLRLPVLALKCLSVSVAGRELD